MNRRKWPRTFCFLLIACAASAQTLGIGGINSSSTTSALPMSGVNVSLFSTTDALFNGINHSPLENPNIALSKLDLKAPAKAQHEYSKGYQLLMKKQFPEAVQHLSFATSIYPSYVAAHNALGSAYLGLGQNDEARAQFTQAAGLDDHLPNSFLNLGCAELALQDYQGAEKNIAKAAIMAPLDLQLLTTLAYSQYMNHDYAAVVTTAHTVHERKHPRAAMVHFYAAAAWQAQGNGQNAISELSVFLKEDPGSPAATAAREMIAQLRDQAHNPPRMVTTTAYNLSFTIPIQIPQDPDAARITKAQAAKESTQIAEAESESECPNCALADAPAERTDSSASNVAKDIPPSQVFPQGYTFHAATEEVALFFAATDRGKSVTDLGRNDVTLLDDRKAPAVVTGFRNEAQLPLRLGLVLDTSDSIAKRFKFEKAATIDFLTSVITRDDDLAFVVGFANSVLLVQDFTNDHQLTGRGIDQLVPAGGTSLWDAVAFASDKLSARVETQPVAKILVVISDGEDNSSSATARQAINRAQRGEVTVYTISTRDLIDNTEDSLVGQHALRALAELTGGDVFTPGSVGGLNGSLRELQQVIRSRYFISYKPADFKHDGRYRPIDVTATKSGRKLRVLARHGYIASPDSRSDPY